MLGFGLGLVQMLVYAIYRNRGEKSIKKEKMAPIEALKIVVESKVEKNKDGDDDDVEKKDKSEELIACGV